MHKASFISAELEESINRTEEEIYPYLYVFMKICCSWRPYIGLWRRAVWSWNKSLTQRTVSEKSAHMWLERSCIIGEDEDISCDTLSLSSPVGRAENISKTICPPRPLRLCLCSFQALHYHYLLILFAVSLAWLMCMSFFTGIETKCCRKKGMKWRRKAESFAKGAGKQRFSLIQRSDSALCSGSGSGPVWAPPVLFSQAWHANCNQFLAHCPPRDGGGGFP